MYWYALALKFCRTARAGSQVFLLRVHQPGGKSRSISYNYLHSWEDTRQKLAPAGQILAQKPYARAAESRGLWVGAIIFARPAIKKDNILFIVTHTANVFNFFFLNVYTKPLKSPLLYCFFMWNTQPREKTIERRNQILIKTCPLMESLWHQRSL